MRLERERKRERDGETRVKLFLPIALRMRSVRFAGNAPTLYLLIHMMYMSFPREFTFSLTIPRSYARFAISFERNTAFVGCTRSKSDELRANIDDDDYDDDSDDDRVAENESRNFAFACWIYRESTLLYPLRCIHQLYQMAEKTHTHTYTHTRWSTVSRSR